MGRKVRAGCPQSCGRGTGAFPVVAGLVRLRHVGWQVMVTKGWKRTCPRVSEAVVLVVLP